MKLFRSEEEVLQDNKKKQEKEKEKQDNEKEKEKKLKKFYEDINITDSEDDIKILEQIRMYSKRKIKDSFKTITMSGDILLNETISKSIFLEFYILKQLSSSRKAINTLVEQNKELENKFDTIIKQNEELNNKFDQLIEILKSK